ncbi:transmembrane protein [Anaeramoeba flamelloides]|uniref:Transmembrane protein n=1 Tax=Anaeramoeba flamelloides TaxID=1746091 RepID=A0AAV7YS11_9EUKA|nr:transmembrane protein [Anaeramoeba flamelloides]
MCSFLFIAIIITFFFFSVYATKLNAKIKKQTEDHYKPSGHRNYKQVLSNGGSIPPLICLLTLKYFNNDTYYLDFATNKISSIVVSMFAGFYCSSLADTLSSEIGIASKGLPRLITKPWKKVMRGTNGAVSLLGFLASLFGGFAIGMNFYIHYLLYHYGLINNQNVMYNNYKSQWPFVIICVFTGFFGSLVDSILGATLEPTLFCTVKNKIVKLRSPTTITITGHNILSNNLVNFISCTIACLFCLGLSYWVYC